MLMLKVIYFLIFLLPLFFLVTYDNSKDNNIKNISYNKTLSNMDTFCLQRCAQINKYKSRDQTDGYPDTK